MPQNSQVQIRVPRALYEQIAALARAADRPIAREVKIALEVYLERAIRGSQRWHELAGEESK